MSQKLDDAVRELLVDGFTVTSTGETMGLLQAVELYCTGLRSKEAGRFSKGPGSRPPVGLSALSFLSEVYRGSRELHAELSEQVIGTAKRGPAHTCLQRLPLLASSGRAWPESVEDAEHATARWIRKAKLLLDEIRPDAAVRALSCPHCTEVSLKLVSSDNYSVGILYCGNGRCVAPNGTRYEWSAETLGDFMAEVFTQAVA